MDSFSLYNGSFFQSHVIFQLLGCVGVDHVPAAKEEKWSRTCYHGLGDIVHTNSGKTIVKEHQTYNAVICLTWKVYKKPVVSKTESLRLKQVLNYGSIVFLIIKCKGTWVLLNLKVKRVWVVQYLWFFFCLESCCRLKRENCRQVQQTPICSGWWRAPDDADHRFRGDVHDRVAGNPKEHHGSTD